MRFYGHFEIANQKSRKAIDTIRVILNEINLSSFMESLRRLFPLYHLFPALDHFAVLLL